jgi:hypothetical protein
MSFTYSGRKRHLSMEDAIVDHRGVVTPATRPGDPDPKRARRHRLLPGPIEAVARRALAAGGLFVGGAARSVWTTAVVPALAGEFVGLYLVGSSHPTHLRRNDDALTELIQWIRKYTAAGWRASGRHLTSDDHRFFEAWERRGPGNPSETVRVVNAFTDLVLLRGDEGPETNAGGGFRGPPPSSGPSPDRDLAPLFGRVLGDACDMSIDDNDDDNDDEY